MKAANPVARPPSKPLLLYDGDCEFCSQWVSRWRETTGDQVEFLPFQDPRVATEFPELNRAALERAAHLVETDGTVWTGAEAIFRSLAHHRDHAGLLKLYADFPFFADLSEWVYGFVARHRTLFSRATRAWLGRAPTRREHQLVRWTFLRGLGLIYLCAFLSLWAQLDGLIGSRGILPARLRMEALERQANQAQLKWSRCALVPTLCWWNRSDAFLHGQCAAAVVLAALVVGNVAPAPCLALLWLLYLSLTTVGGEFLSFQWDSLLLETGFLALFFAPLQLRPGLARAPPPSRLALWLLRWLLFRLMFASGCVKLLSGDPSWRHLTALSFHYETQPLPTWVGWYAFQFPAWTHEVCTALMFGTELFVPFLLFGPRRAKQVACVSFIFLQALIFLTGNYCFFNLLTALLCVCALDDAALHRLVPERWRPRLEAIRAAVIQPTGWKGTLARARWPGLVLVPVAAALLMVSLMQFAGMFGAQVRWPRASLLIYQRLEPFRSCNHYGLFAVMTTSRPEIIIEGSNDGTTWVPYEFKYKPGDLNRRPGFVEPHQPRLDWQMWFAALGDYRQNPWLVNFCVRLLQGSPEVTGLLARNPFHPAPPRYVRALVYDYRFTDLATRRRTGAWWRRELRGEYLPVLSLGPQSQNGIENRE